MQVIIRAKSNDEGGISASFDKQLKELGAEATLVEESEPYRVDSSDSWYFEVRRVYDITF